MSYTPSVPQANQRIATTQPTILNNFTYLNNALQEDHVFNGNSTATLGTHLQTSMPGQTVLSGSLPAGTNGTYYVDKATPTANAQFYDGTNNYVLNNWRGELGGTVTFSSINTPTPIGISSLSTLPDQVFGIIYFYGPTASVSPSNIVTCSNVFFTSSNAIRSQYSVPNAAQPIILDYGALIATNVTASISTTAEIGQYWWTLFYRNRG